jgi:hypothetical protein
LGHLKWLGDAMREETSSIDLAFLQIGKEFNDGIF